MLVVFVDLAFIFIKVIFQRDVNFGYYFRTLAITNTMK